MKTFDKKILLFVGYLLEKTWIQRQKSTQKLFVIVSIVYDWKPTFQLNSKSYIKLYFLLFEKQKKILKLKSKKKCHLPDIYMN